MDIQSICNWVVLISAVILAITNIYNFFKKPVNSIQKYQDEQLEKKISQYLEKILPDILNKQAEQMIDARNKEYGDLLKKVDDLLVERTSKHLKEIKQTMNSQYNEITILKKTTLDLLRKNILEIYHCNKDNRQLTETDREYLDDLYKDYSAEGGNSYIAKKYNRMCKWNIIPDEEEEEN